MRRRQALALFLAAAMAVTAAMTVSPPLQPAVAAPQSGGGGTPVSAFFATCGEFPSLVQVELLTPADDHPLTTAISGLIAGAPVGAPLRTMVPAGTKLNGVTVANGIATIDFSTEITTANVGSFGEAMLIASIADTAAQFPTVQKVQLLVDGRITESIGGHILASEPLNPDYGMLPQGFADSVGHWAERQINAMSLRGVINGYPDKTFRPERRVSRAEIIKLVVAAVGDVDWSRQTRSFADVAATHPLYAYIETAVASGVVVPADYRQPDGSFRLNPDGACTRREAAVMLVRAAGLGARAQELAGQPLPWLDTTTQPAWAAGVLLAASESGLMNGYPDNTFRPSGTLTRAEAATVIARLTGCAPGPVIAPAVRSGEALGAPGLLVIGVCPTGTLLRLDLRAADGSMLTSHSLMLRRITDACSYFAALMPSDRLAAGAATAEVVAQTGAAPDDIWRVALPPR